MTTIIQKKETATIRRMLLLHTSTTSTARRYVCMILFLLLVLLLCNQSHVVVLAITAAPYTFPLDQPGSYNDNQLHPLHQNITMELQMYGDENIHFVVDEQEYPVVELTNGWHVYAMPHQLSGDLVATPFAVGTVDPNHIIELTNDPHIVGHAAAVSATNKYLHNKKDNNNSDILPTRLTHLKCHGSNNKSPETIASNDGLLRKTIDHDDIHKCHSERRRLLLEHDVEHKERQQRIRKLIDSTGQLQHLVVLIEFDDHTDRNLPRKSHYDKLFNEVGGHDVYAPTGSVKDVFDVSSYGKLDVVTTVHRWTTISKGQSYYADDTSGLNSKLFEAVTEVLDIMEDDDDFDFKDFDIDDDGYIDAITFVHSGYGAEWGGSDCNGISKEGRIWSHMRKNSRSIWCSRGNSNNRVCLRDYQFASGLWGRCGTADNNDNDSTRSDIAHIGVMAHEIGHFLGLLDMYDGRGEGKGNGIGSFGLMGNCWGFDRSQQYPPLLDPMSKLQLGWIQSITIDTSNYYTIAPAHEWDYVYKIDTNFPDGEYILIENRQRTGFEAILPQDGALIWHIDEKANHIDEGYPGQDGWPENGNHYKIAIASCDGNYDLERTKNLGDSTDIWTSENDKCSKRVYGPYEITKQYPNTDSYQNGIIKPTWIVLQDFIPSYDEDGYMEFTALIPGSVLPQPTPNPTTNPTPSPTYTPTSNPTTNPTLSPTLYPTLNPSVSPSTSKPTKQPTNQPSPIPSSYPTTTITLSPTSSPTTFTFSIEFDEEEKSSSGSTTATGTNNDSSSTIIKDTIIESTGTTGSTTMTLPSMRLRIDYNDNTSSMNDSLVLLTRSNMLQYTSMYVGSLLNQAYNNKADDGTTIISGVTVQLASIAASENNNSSLLNNNNNLLDDNMQSDKTSSQQISMATTNEENGVFRRRLVSTTTSSSSSAAAVDDKEARRKQTSLGRNLQETMILDFITTMNIKQDTTTTDIPTTLSIIELLLMSMNGPITQSSSFLYYLSTIPDISSNNDIERVSLSLTPSSSSSGGSNTSNNNFSSNNDIAYTQGMNSDTGSKPKLTSLILLISISTISGCVVLCTICCTCMYRHQQTKGDNNNLTSKDTIVEITDELHDSTAIQAVEVAVDTPVLGSISTRRSSPTSKYHRPTNTNKNDIEYDHPAAAADDDSRGDLDDSNTGHINDHGQQLQHQPNSTTSTSEYTEYDPEADDGDHNTSTTGEAIATTVNQWIGSLTNYVNNTLMTSAGTSNTTTTTSSSRR